MSGVLAWTTSTAMVVGPVIGYLDQYRKIAKERTTEGFSHKVCGVLLVSNILRVIFWIGKRFDAVLLWQALLMILVQAFLLDLCIRNQPQSQQHVPFTCGGFLRQFWLWSDTLPYFAFLTAFTLVAAFWYYVLVDLLEWTAVIEVYGLVSLSIEATVPLPQLIHIIRTQSTEGFSNLILASWVLGDGYKTLFFIFTAAPFQFVVCGVFQLSVDLVILAYYWYLHIQAIGSPRHRYSELG